MVGKPPVPSAPDPLMTPAELAEECKVEIATIYSWRTRGMGPKGFKLAGSLRFRRSEVRRWLAESGDTAQVAAAGSRQPVLRT